MTGNADQSTESTIDIYVDRNYVMHVYANGIALMPIPLACIDTKAEPKPPAPAADVETKTTTQAPARAPGHNHDWFRQTFTRIERQLETIAIGIGRVTRVEQYGRNIERIGTALGRMLFGAHRVPAGISTSGSASGVNGLHLTLERLYRSSDRVSICFAAALPQVERMPWEMALWQLGGRDIALGADARLTFSRRACYSEYDEPRIRVPVADSLAIAHVTSSEGESDNQHSEFRAQHKDMAAFLDQLAERHARVRVSAQYTPDWTHSEDTDIFQFYGHGFPAKLDWIGVDSPYSARHVGAGDLIQLLDDNALPALFVLVACQSFDPMGMGQRGLACDLLEGGATAVVGMLGGVKIGTGESLLKIFYAELFRSGRLDVAMQRARRIMRKQAFQCLLDRSDRAPFDWFRPVLVVRDRQSLVRFAEHRTSAVPRGLDSDRGAITRSLSVLFSARDEMRPYALSFSHVTVEGPVQERDHACAGQIDPDTGQSIPRGTEIFDDRSENTDVLNQVDDRETCQWQTLVEAVQYGMADEDIDNAIAQPFREQQ